MAKGDHAAFIAGWLGPRAAGRSGGELLKLLDAAMSTLYRTAGLTLSHVTLQAVAERVAVHTRERFPAFEGLEVTKSGLSTGRMRKKSNGEPAAEIAQLVEFVLTEFLTVLGNLTADILTPRLHAALTRMDAGAPSGGARRGKTREAKKK